MDQRKMGVIVRHSAPHRLPIHHGLPDAVEMRQVVDYMPRAPLCRIKDVAGCLAESHSGCRARSASLKDYLTALASWRPAYQKRPVPVPRAHPLEYRDA